jgi:hypothetical protein
MPLGDEAGATDDTKLRHHPAHGEVCRSYQHTCQGTTEKGTWPTGVAGVGVPVNVR